MEIIVKKRTLQKPSESVIGDNADYSVHFQFDSEWNGVVKTARFERKNGEFADAVLVNDKCDIPVQILKSGFLKIGVYSEKMTTTPTEIYVNASIKERNGVQKEPGLDIYGQLLSKIESLSSSGVDQDTLERIVSEETQRYIEENGIEIDASKVNTMISQYVTAHKNELKGENGANGTNGTNGTNGKSAYDLWIEAGNTGTVNDFLTSLKGEKGDTGASSSGGTVSDEQISNAVSSYLTENPIETGINEEQVNNIISTFFNEHKDELKGEKGDTGASGSGGNVTNEQISQAVNDYLVENPIENITSPIYDASGFSKSSIDIAHEMLIGYNIGDYMDACNCRTWAYTIPSNVLDRAKFIETLWGNVRVTEDFIKYLANIGIQAIRLPITWLEFIDENNNMISKDWLNRAETIITWIIENGMYCIINLHHDGLISWEHTRQIILEESYMIKSTAYACNLWGQIAEHFKDFGYKLLFETFNEVCDTSKSMSATSARNALAVRLNKSIIDTIRKTGGNNVNRFIGCSAYGGVSFLPSNLMNELREYDSADDKLLSCSHQYPSGNASLSALSNGYGQYHGEIGWNPSENRTSYVADLHTKVQTLKHPCFWWDNGARDFSIINRMYIEPSYKSELEAFVGKTLEQSSFTYPDMADNQQPYYAKFKTEDFDNKYGAKYVVICTAKPITEVKESTMCKSDGFYQFIGCENGLVTMYLSDDDITYKRYITRIATSFSAIRDNFHILGSTENTVLVDSNYTFTMPDAPTQPVSCTGLSLNETSLSFTTNSTQTLVASKTPSDTTESLTWTSSNTTIATVSNSGVVTAKANGTCVITATCGSKTATCNVNVNIATSGGDTPSGGDEPSDDEYDIYEWNGTSELTDGFELGDMMQIVNSDEYGTYITSTSEYSKPTRGVKLNSLNAKGNGNYVEADFVILGDLRSGTTNARTYASVAIGNSSVSKSHAINGNGTNTNLFTDANISETVGTKFTLKIIDNFTTSIADGATVYVYDESGEEKYTNTSLSYKYNGNNVPSVSGAYANAKVGITRVKVAVKKTS